MYFINFLTNFLFEGNRFLIFCLLFGFIVDTHELGTRDTLNLTLSRRHFLVIFVFHYQLQQTSQFCVLHFQIVKILLRCTVDHFQSLFGAIESKHFQKTENGSSAYLHRFLLIRAINYFLQQNLSTGQSMCEVFRFCHDQRMQTVDTFMLQV